MGIQPDILICRSDHPVNPNLLNKIALFTGVDSEAVIPLETVDSVYKVPVVLEKFNLHKITAKKLKLKGKKDNGQAWNKFLKKLENLPDKVVRIGLIGKYMGMKDTYYSVTEALKTAAVYNNVKIQIDWIDAEKIEKEGPEKMLKDIDGVVVPGGFGSRGVEGKIQAIKYAREQKIPFLGLCYGLQLATIEFARHACQMSKANTTEIDPKTPYPVVYIMPEQEKLLEGSKYGATMRLGAYPCKLKTGTTAYQAYKKSAISERHRHRYEVNNKYKKKLEEKGLVISGTSPNGKLVEIIEIVDHPFFLATQFHPELKSRPLDPHPLFIEFIKATLNKYD